jgi:hypothetical protein
VILDAYRKIEAVVREQFSDLVINTQIIHAPSGRARKLRINLFDGSYIDVWYSKAKEYSYHWERRMLDGNIFRHDNAPHKKWQSVKTFPRHFHYGTEGKVQESHISSNPIKAITEFMSFAKKILARPTHKM